MTDHRKTAVYIRLSAEDDNVDGRAKKESDSVTSQRILLKSFVIDQLGVAESDILEYVDDGVSGTHFKRQGFQQLQDDMKSGEIGCVVVKDFSRFGRDYLEVGFYIEYIFPLLQIRFISINDSYDSAASSGMTGGMNVALQNLVYNMYSLDLSKKISSALQTRTRNGTRLPVNARYGYKKGKDGRLEVDPEAAKVVKMIFRMAAEGTSFADITRELNRQEIVTCDEQKLSRGDQVQFQRFETIKKKHWSPTTVAAIVRDEIYIGTRIWGKTRCSMHTGHKAVLNDETEWVRLENHHTAIIDRALFEKANEMHPKKKRSVAESRTNFILERRKKQPALLLCANCGHSLLKETEHLLKCSDARTNGDPVCRSLVLQRELLEEPSVIVADIGGWTVDLMRLDNRIPNASTCRSLELGMIRCLDEIGEQIRRTLGLSMTAAQMESVLRGDAVHINEDARKIIDRQADAYVHRLLSAITESGLDTRAMPAVFLGGGAALLKRNVSAADGLCRPVILDDVSLNAKGYERLAERLTKNDEQ